MTILAFQTVSADYDTGDDIDIFIDSFGNKNIVWRESVNGTAQAFYEYEIVDVVYDQNNDCYFNQTINANIVFDDGYLTLQNCIINGNIKATRAQVVIEDCEINGNVNHKLGSFTVESSGINGNIDAENSDFELRTSYVNGNVKAKTNTDESYSTIVTGDTVNGNVDLKSGICYVVGNAINGNLKVKDPAIIQEVSDNDVNGNTQLTDNTSGFDGYQITNSTLDVMYPQVAIDSASGMAYALWVIDTNGTFEFWYTVSPDMIYWLEAHYAGILNYTAGNPELDFEAVNGTLYVTWLEGGELTVAPDYNAPPSLEVVGISASEPVVYLNDPTTITLELGNSGNGSALYTVVNVTDIVGETETLIDSSEIGMMRPGTENVYLFNWTPAKTGIHYLIVEMLGNHIEHHSPAALVESPPTVMSFGFPVSPLGAVEEWKPSNGLNVVTASEGIRYRDGPRIITVKEGDLIIQSGATLQLNDSVTFVIENTFPEWYTNKHGINIESGGKFLINSPSRSTVIQSSSGAIFATYPFLNSGVVDFLGANVTYTYGDTTDLTKSGGIQNKPGSVCNLTDCRVEFADTHSVIANSSDMRLEGSGTLVGKGNDNPPFPKGSGITIKGDSDVAIDGITVECNEEHGIKCVDTEIQTRIIDKFSDGSESKMLTYYGQGSQTVNVSLPKNASIASSSFRIEGGYRTLAGAEDMHPGHYYAMYCSANTIWTGDAGSVQLYAGWNADVDYSGVWSYARNVDVIMAETGCMIISEAPFAPTVDVGNDGSSEWVCSGRFSTSVFISDANTTPTLSQQIQNYMDTHSSDEDGNVVVPLKIYSGSSGIIEVSDLIIQFAEESKITNCEIKSNMEAGVHYENSSTTTVDSKIHDNGGDGIVCVEGAAPLLTGNNVSWNVRNGIAVEDSKPSIVGSTNIDWNGGHGIFVQNVTGNGLLIDDNHVRKNLGSGIWCDKANATIANNTVSDNGRGLIFSYDVEDNPTGTLIEGLWHRVNNQSGAAPAWNISHSGDWALWCGYEHGEPLVGDYNHTSIRNNVLGTGMVNLTNASSASLVFWSWYESGDANDTCQIEIAPGAGGDHKWYPIDNNQQSTWTRQIIDISQFVGNNVFIYFLFNSDSIDNDYRGWYIDDIQIISSYPAIEGYGIFYGNHPSATIINNTAIGNNWEGIYLFNSNGSVLERNMCDLNQRNGITLGQSSNVIICDTMVHGSKYGIVAKNSYGVFDNCTIELYRNQNTYGITFSGASPSTVIGCNVSNCDVGFKISSFQPENLTPIWRNNWIYNVGYVVITNYHPAGGMWIHVNMTGNNISCDHLSGVNFASSMFLDNNTINCASGILLDCPHIIHKSSIVTNNRFNYEGYAIGFQGTSPDYPAFINNNTFFCGNKLSSNGSYSQTSSRAGIYMMGSSFIKDNTFIGSPFRGVCVEHWPWNLDSFRMGPATEIVNNEFINVPESAIFCRRGSGATIQSNQFTNCSFGVTVSPLTNPTILDNEFESCRYGMLINSTDCLIDNNMITKSSMSGIHAIGSHGTINNTLIENCSNGISLANSGFYLANNTIINCTNGIVQMGLQPNMAIDTFEVGKSATLEFCEPALQTSFDVVNIDSPCQVSNFEFTLDGLGISDGVAIGTEVNETFDSLIADFDQDGENELITASAGWSDVPVGHMAAKLTVYEKDGNDGLIKSSEQVLPYPMGVSVWRCNINGDEYPDLMVRDGIGVNKLYSWLNDGAGGFIDDGMKIQEDNSLNGICLVDIDGDGFDDVLVTNVYYHNSTTFRSSMGVCLNDGDGTFGSKMLIYDFYNELRAITAADFDGDGDNDICLTKGRNINFIRNDGYLSFIDMGSFSTEGNDVDAIETADVNLDGRIDILTTQTSFAPNEYLLTAYTNNYNWQFDERSSKIIPSHCNRGFGVGLLCGQYPDCVLPTDDPTLFEIEPVMNPEIDLLLDGIIDWSYTGLFKDKVIIDEMNSTVDPTILVNNYVSGSIPLNFKKLIAANADAITSGYMDVREIDILYRPVTAIINCTIINNGDGISSTDSIMIISQSNVSQNGGRGIYGQNSTMNILDGNVVSDNHYQGILLDSSNGVISGNVIQRNHEPSNTPPDTQLTGIHLRNCQNIQIGNNNISYNGVNILLDHSNGVNIEWNQITDESAAIMIYPNAAPPRGIYSVSSQMTASNNTIWGTIYGMDIRNADASTIVRDNHFYPLDAMNGPWPTHGIHLDNASIYIHGNQFSQVDTGIYCAMNSNAVIVNNTVIDGAIGIYSNYSSPMICDNVIENNSGWGILCEYAAPANSGNDTAALLVANPGLGSNGLGKCIQYWMLEVYITESGLPVADAQINVRPLMGEIVASGYTDANGYAWFKVVQDYATNDDFIPVLNPYLIDCEGQFYSDWTWMDANRMVYWDM